MGRNEPGNIAWIEAAWLRWAVVIAALVSWAAIAYVYPVYFQRDDFRLLDWTQRHSYVHCFSPTADNVLWHDGMYRPALYVAWMTVYKLFGMNPAAFQFIFGCVFIVAMAYLSKLVSRVAGRREGWLTLAVWLAAFNTLLTSLFWFAEAGNNGLEILLGCSGLYLFATGFGASAKRMVFGSLLMLAAFFAKEPAVVIFPTVVAVYVATYGPSICKWSRAKTTVYSILPLLVTPLYLTAFPYAIRRSVAPDTAAVAAAAGVAEQIWSRFSFYAHVLGSGATGLILLAPAVYYIISRLTNAKSRGGFGVPGALLGAVVIWAAIVKTGLYSVAVPVLVIAALMLPRRYYFFIPWLIVPLAGLCFFKGVTRNYLYEMSLAASALAAIQAGVLVREFAEWWKARVKSRAISYAALALFVIAVLGFMGAKGRSRMVLLRLRSDYTMTFQELIPHIEKLPRDSNLIVVDYASMFSNVSRQMLTWTDREKIMNQAPVQMREMASLAEVIGRPDLKIPAFSDYTSGSFEHDGKRVFLMLLTPKDHEFVDSLGIDGRPHASVRRGQGRMDIIELRPQ